MYYNTLKNYLGEYNIIVINNKDIGIFAVDESYKGESYISEISLNKEYQNKGIGTDILNNLLIKNKQKGLKTKLKVFKNNPAKKLYERLGFSVYGENGITLSDGKNVELNISLLISIKISRVGEIAIFFYVVDLYLIYVFYIKKYYI